MRRPTIQTRWRGLEGYLVRWLELSTSCPWCRQVNVRKLDVLERCSPAHVVPVECMTCPMSTKGVFYAMPLGDFDALECVHQDDQVYAPPARRPSLLERFTKWLWPKEVA